MDTLFEKTVLINPTSPKTPHYENFTQTYLSYKNDGFEDLSIPFLTDYVYRR